MNSLVKELVKQATRVEEPDGLLPREVFDEDKFAQLIAKECAKLAMILHHSTSPADYSDMDPYEQGCDDTASRISGLIRRTFGVEE